MQAFIFILALSGVTQAQQTDVCTQVSLMSQYCSTQGANGSEAGEVATMKVLDKKMNTKMIEMESRLRQTLESPPEVNYTFVEQTIAKRFKGVEARVIRQLGEPPKVNYTAIEEDISSRFSRLEDLVNGYSEDGQSIVNYSRIIGHVDGRFEEIKYYVDSKFSRMVSDTETYKNAVKAMDGKLNITDCRDVRAEDAKICLAGGGVFDIYRGMKKYEVFCDGYTDGGGWTVFQRRIDGSLLFNRTWEEYVEGFGEKHKEFWLGLKNINELLQQGTHELRIDMTDSIGSRKFTNYGIFHMFGKARDYSLVLQSYTGDAGNNLSPGIPFSTFDQEHDTHSSINCAKHHKGGGWWYTDCGYSSLNGLVGRTYQLYWTGLSNIVKSEMKFRRLIE